VEEVHVAVVAPVAQTGQTEDASARQGNPLGRDSIKFEQIELLGDSTPGSQAQCHSARAQNRDFFVHVGSDDFVFYSPNGHLLKIVVSLHMYIRIQISKEQLRRCKFTAAIPTSLFGMKTHEACFGYVDLCSVLACCSSNEV